MSMRRHHARRKRRTGRQALRHGPRAKARHMRRGGRTGSSRPSTGR